MFELLEIEIRVVFSYFQITIPLTLLTSETSTKLILDAGNGECVLYTSPLVTGQNLFLHLPSFDQLATPVNGAYFLILAVLIFGGLGLAASLGGGK